MNDFDFEISGSESIDNLLSKARNFIAAGDYNNAKPLISQILKQDPRNAKALWMYANIVMDTEPEKAIQSLKRLLEVDPANTKARTLLDKLDDDDPFPINRSTPINQPPYQQPVINVHVNNTANSQAVGTGQHVVMIQGKQVNQTAFILGSFAAFFGFFGIAHVLNGKIGKGVIWLILGFVWDAIFLAISLTGVLACIGFAIHVYMMYSVSKEGATYETVNAVGVPMQMNIGRQ